MAPSLHGVQVLPGSVLVLTGVDFGVDEFAPLGRDPLSELADEIERAAGHRLFVILQVDDGGEVEVWGPDVDLKAKVQELLGKQAAA